MAQYTCIAVKDSLLNNPAYQPFGTYPMNRSSLVVALVALFIVLTMPKGLIAQDAISFKGVLFSDYSYVLNSPERDFEGQNGFGFRRARLTADFKKSDRFSGRLRFESSDDSQNVHGKPAPYIKDLYVKWKNVIGAGHTATLGLSRPPIWGASEDHWGYRAIEKTIQDRAKIANSRDIGIGLDGPISPDGRLTYSAMFANNSAGKAETDKFKRVYGLVGYAPSAAIQMTVASDYYAFDGGSSLNINAFLGYTLEKARIGVEGFYNPISFDGMTDEDIRNGISVYGSYDLSDSRRIIARYDYSDRDNRGAESAEDWATIGFAFRLESGVEFIPNLIYQKSDLDDDPTITGRLTAWVSF